MDDDGDFVLVDPIPGFSISDIENEFLVAVSGFFGVEECSGGVSGRPESDSDFTHKGESTLSSPLELLTMSVFDIEEDVACVSPLDCGAGPDPWPNIANDDECECKPPIDGLLSFDEVPESSEIRRILSLISIESSRTCFEGSSILLMTLLKIRL